MWDKIIDLVMSNGIWATLFVVMLIYTLQDVKKREDKYIDVIDKLSDKFEILQDIGEKVEDIEDKLNQITKSEK